MPLATNTKGFNWLKEHPGDKLKDYQRWDGAYFNASCYYMYGLELWNASSYVRTENMITWGWLMPVVYCHRYEFYGLNN